MSDSAVYPTRGFRDVLVVVPTGLYMNAARAFSTAKDLLYPWVYYENVLYYLPIRGDVVTVVSEIDEGELDQLLETCRRHAHPSAPDACRYCGCTESRACAGGCYWVAPEVCSVCDELMREIALQGLDTLAWASFDDLWKMAADHLLARRRVLYGEPLTMVAGQALSKTEEAACDALEQSRTLAFRTLRDVAEQLLKFKDDDSSVSPRESALLNCLAGAVVGVDIYVDNDGEEDSSDRKAEGPASDNDTAGDPKSSSSTSTAQQA